LIVSVVIPCFNAAGWIARAVQSVLAQNHTNVEIIVIDDGSTDGTGYIIRSFKNITSGSTPNLGACHARNAGLGLATGDFVLFLDADDYIEAGSLHEWMKYATEADVVLGPFVHERGRQRTAGEGPGPEENRIAVACQWLNGRYTASCSVLWRASFIRAMGGWAEDLLRNQDAEIAIRGLLNGARVRIAPRGCGVYAHHDDAGRISNRAGRQVSLSELSSLEKLWTLAQARGQRGMQSSFAAAFYRIAYRCFVMGVEDIGELALTRARELGLKGHIGSLGHRVFSGFLGLRNKLLVTGIVKGRPRFPNEQSDIPRRVVYVQYTNPAIYPPLEQSVRIFADHGWEVTLMGIEVSGAFNGMRFGTTHIVKVDLLPLWGSGWMLKLHYAWFIVWCCWKVRVLNPDLVYVSDPITCLAGAALGATTSVDLIYHEHDSPVQGIPGPIAQLILRARKIVAKKAYLCVLPNPVRAQEFAAAVQTSAPVLCVMNCPSRRDVTNRSRGRDYARELAVYYHGSIVPERVPVVLLDALALLPDRVRLTLVGAETNGYPDYVAFLKDETARRRLEGRVRFEGLVTPRTKLLRVCAENDIGLALIPKETLDPNLRSMAGASVKIFDYLACGLAVLVSDLPDHERLFVANGVAKSCDPRSAESIASALSWFLNHPEDTRQMGERGRRRVQEDWNYEKQFLPVLKRVAGR
jgi:glycosyltransferase involved in cell wall biosynthesis